MREIMVTKPLYLIRVSIKIYRMFKSYLYTFVILFSLVFNIQAGYAHDIEHIDHESHQSSADCGDCLLNYHLDKSNDLSIHIEYDFSIHTKPKDNYLISKTFVYRFVAYQSRAP